MPDVKQARMLYWGLGGATLGGGLGYAGSEEGHKLEGTLEGAASGGLAGLSLGSLWNHPQAKWDPHSSQRGSYSHEEAPFGWGGPREVPLHEEVPWMKGVGTKADAKKMYRDLSRQHHPDRGGSTSRMQEINSQWDKVQGHPTYAKMSFDLGFSKAAEQFGLTPEQVGLMAHKMSPTARYIRSHADGSWHHINADGSVTRLTSSPFPVDPSGNVVPLDAPGGPYARR